MEREREISLESRKYSIISQITDFENEKVIQRIEDFLYLISLQTKYDKKLHVLDNDLDLPKNIFIEQNFT